ncbi:MAG TPA: hypothetical protein DCR10_02100 [Acidimicrobiaceae bacterium]|nr:hypothetical protein [Acidimicrobiaceae bacterium]
MTERSVESDTAARARGPLQPLRIAALVKQIPKFEDMRLGADGRLIRDGLALHMNDYCRRGVRAGCDLAEATGGTCTAITLGPESADTVLREAILCGCDAGLHVTGSDFAGSDTLATSRALAAALVATGPWDLVMCGRNSVDADTGQVPAQIAELLGLPLLVGARELSLGGDQVDRGMVAALLEHDDEWLQVETSLPTVVSCAERLCDPCKVKEPEAWAEVDGSLIRRIGADELGSGPWGAAASPTVVGEVRVLDVERAAERLDGATDVHLDRIIEVLVDRSALVDNVHGPIGEVARPSGPGDGGDIVVLGEPGRTRPTAELLGAAASLADQIGGRTILTVDVINDWEALSGQGADRVLRHAGTTSPAEVAQLLAEPLADRPPWAVLATGTAWGREVAARLAVRLEAGLTGDAVGLEARDGRLIALKPAFGGRMVAEIAYSSITQMATVRAGVFTSMSPRPTGPFASDLLPTVGEPPAVREVSRHRDDDSDLLANANIVVSVGQGIGPEDLDTVRDLTRRLGGELCATRKVTDAGWLPRARQVGITGHSIAPRLCIAVGTSGRFNHTVGLRNAGTVVGINSDPNCELWDWCDVGLIADWRDALEPLVDRIVALADES